MTPLHEATQTMARVFENMTSAVSRLDIVVQHFQASTTHALILAPSPGSAVKTTVGGKEFMRALNECREAFLYLQQAKLKNAEKLSLKLRELIEGGVVQLEQLLRQSLISADREDQLQVKRLGDLVSYLAGYEVDNALNGTVSAPKTSYLNTLTSVRSDLLANALQGLSSTVSSGSDPNLAQSPTKLMSASLDRSTGAYVRGSSGFIKYSETMLHLVALEWKFLQSVMPGYSGNTGSVSMSRSRQKNQIVVAMEGIVKPAFDNYAKVVETILSRTRGSRQSFDIGATYLLMDCLDTLLRLTNDEPDREEWMVALSNCGKRSGDIDTHIAQFGATAVQMLPDFIETIRSSATKSSYLPDDGTVHELTSDTLSFLRRLCEYYECVESILLLFPGDNGQWEPLSLPQANGTLDVAQLRARIVAGRIKVQAKRHSTAFIAPRMQQLYADACVALSSNLETKAKGYKKSNAVSATDKNANTRPILSTIFLLNNYHYIVKVVRSHPALQQMVGTDSVTQIDKRLRQELDVYMQSWQPLLTTLMDTTILQQGQLSKADRQVIKDKFRKFNDEFEECYKSQKKYAVPDLDLRAQLIKDIKQIVVPMYTRFLDKYSKTQFTENPGKYLKFDVNTMEMLINKFFDPSSQ